MPQGDHTGAVPGAHQGLRGSLPVGSVRPVVRSDESAAIVGFACTTDFVKIFTIRSVQISQVRTLHFEFGANQSVQFEVMSSIAPGMYWLVKQGEMRQCVREREPCVP